MSRLLSLDPAPKKSSARPKHLIQDNPSSPFGDISTVKPLKQQGMECDHLEAIDDVSSPHCNTRVNATHEPRKSRKIVLPCFTLTELCESTDDGAVQIVLPNGASESAYYERPKLTRTGQRLDGRGSWKPSQFNVYPVVLHATGLPWPEANAYILSRLENTLNPSMSTYDGIADDLAAFCRFLDDEAIDWRIFPDQKLSRPTYRYSAYLSRAVNSGEIAGTSAKRRMSSVIAFYKWMKSDGMFLPKNLAWRDSDVFLKLTGTYGFEYTKKVRTTDVSIKVAKQDDPFDGMINDGGRLRPLPMNEQLWVIEALMAQGNTVMTLIHLLALFTGARIQTVLTFRLRNLHALSDAQLNAAPSTEIRCPVGPGTGIDTKNDKRMSLHIPLWVYRMLLTYAASDQARRRRLLAKGGDSDYQYLFLSKCGSPFYSGKDDSRIFDAGSRKRQPIKGQSVRTFMSEVVIPYVRAHHDAKFHYKFHDLRATFGMNLTDSQLKLVEQKKRTLSEVREFVKVRMGHKSAATTDLYLQFRGNLAHILQVMDDHDDHLRKLVEQAEII